MTLKAPPERATVEHVEGLARLRTVRRVTPNVRWTDTQGAHVKRVRERCTVGAADGVGLQVVDPTVSRLHAELEPREDGLWIRDLGSRNGVYLEGLLVGSGRIPEGGRVRLGTVTLTVDPEPASAPVEQWPEEHFGPLWGRSAVMRMLFAQLARVARVDSAVLIQGETGTGKDLVARALHADSPRASGPFVPVDCACLPEELVESELFGHAAGAFTGARGERVGLLEEASGGTLFLDELGELPLAIQPKLLRALESKNIRRVGETAYRPVDVRVVSATHRDLGERVNAGMFREDLYFRVAVLELHVPPLRARLEDIPLLVAHLLPPDAARALGAPFLRALQERPWPGNVRELRNALEQANALGEASAGAPAPWTSGVPPVSTELPLRLARERWLDQLDRAYVERLLEEHEHNVAEVAKVAGVDRTYIYRLMRKHQLK